MSARLRVSLPLIVTCMLLLGKTVAAADISLAWDRSDGLTIAGYKLYYGTASRSYGTPIDVGNATSYTVRGLDPGTYYFSVTAYDLLGIESGFSNEASTTIASPACAFSISPVSQSFGAVGGTGDVSVATLTGCTWSASSNVNWVSITSGGTGAGNGAVSYSVAANTTTSSRTGTLTIAGQTFTVSQSGTSCIFSVSPTSQSFGGGEGAGSVAVKGTGGCTWTASTGTRWITIVSGSSGNGSGTVSFSVARNRTKKSRTGALAVAGQTVTVTQGGKNDVYFSQFATGDQWVSSIVLINPSSTETATGTLSLLDGSGQALPTSFDRRSPEETSSFSIKPWGSVTFSTDGAGELVIGSAWVKADIPLSGVVKYSHPGLGVVGVAESIPLRSLMAAVIRMSDKGLNTGIAVTNTLNRPLVLNLSLRAANGRETAGGSAQVMLSGRGHVAGFIDQWFPNADTSNFQGSMIISSNGPEEGLAATSIQVGSGPGEFTTLPVVPVDPQAIETDLYFAHFAGGGEWVTTVFLLNPTNAENPGELRFYDDNGRRLNIAVYGGQAFAGSSSTIPPQGSVSLQGSGLAEMVFGSARFVAQSAIGGVLRFASSRLGIAGVGASEPMTGFIAPMIRNASAGSSTGVAIAALDSPVRATLTLRNENGEVVPGGQTRLELPVNGHVARYLEQLFPEVDTRQFRGTLVVTAEGGLIVGTVLQVGSGPGQITTLPVTEVP